MRYVALLLFCFTSALHAEDVFIEGLPDVPHLPVVTSIEGEPVVFDTPGGTVAEFILNINVAAPAAYQAYNEALTGLGWACTSRPSGMACAREENRLVFSTPEEGENTKRIILRLEPIE
ncbi:hypothetical protein [Kordiimonas sp.]|uniref:hypothetical protein n=1 Tax=Kordiimonas sp. TaxID=1970157 RepID=UPI003A93F528